MHLSRDQLRGLHRLRPLGGENPKDQSHTALSRCCPGSPHDRTAVLLQPLRPRIDGTVDLLLFNPPYVPTPEEEITRGGIAAAWAGGERGRVVIDRVMPQVR